MIAPVPAASPITFRNFGLPGVARVRRSLWRKIQNLHFILRICILHKSAVPAYVGDKNKQHDVRYEGGGEAGVNPPAALSVFRVIREQVAEESARVAADLGGGASEFFGEPADEPLLFDYRERRRVCAAGRRYKLACSY